MYRDATAPEEPQLLVVSPQTFLALQKEHHVSTFSIDGNDIVCHPNVQGDEMYFVPVSCRDEL